MRPKPEGLNKMDTRASTRTRLSVLPVFIALVFNLVAPVVSIALPDAAPAELSPRVAEAAADPAHVNFTFQGCRNPSVNLELTNFVCADGDYTTGNLGKTWNELDLVPHRLTTALGTQGAATELYTVGIVADHIEAGVPGYDFISIPVVNAAKSHASCSVSAGPLLTATPGIGGTDTSMYRLIDISQNKGTTCVFDYYERLAIGSHQFPGSSLHSNMTNQNLGVAGVGSQDISIPVKEILPQEIDKTMSATRGQAYGWAVSKSASPASLNFANTCLDTAGARSQQVQITVTWTRSGPTPSGDTTITTHIYATNPAHRTVTVNVTDRVYEGLTQTAQISEATSGPVNVPKETSDMLILTHQFTYQGNATTFNDVATASYTDLLTGIAVPGQTTATASATTQASTDPAANSSVLVTDTESITGTGLAFSVAALGAVNGAFTNYTAGNSTTGPVNWEHTVSGSGSVTFDKTVTVDEPRITSGTLSDTATILGDNSLELDSDSESVAITTNALVSLTISKTIPTGSLRSGESVTFDFDVTGPNGYSDTASITFNHGDPLTKTTTLTGLAPGTYDVSEQALSGWANHSDQQTTITLPSCSGMVSFNNSTLAPDLGITKTADNETVSAGDPIGFEIELSNSNDPETGPAKDVTLSDELPSGDGIDWSIASVTGTGGFTPAADACQITGDPATGQELDCDFGDLAPGQGVQVRITSDTTGASCTVYSNTAWLHASNHDSISASDSTEVLCPDLDIAKSADASPVDAGDPIGFSIVVSNDGEGTAKNVTLDDPLPGSLALGIDWSVDAVLINGSAVADPSTYCSITGSAPNQTLECSFGDMDEGDTAQVQVSSSTSAPDGCVTATLPNEATADADNHAEVRADDSITIECPALAIEKTADDDVVSAGEQIGFWIEVSNSSDAGTGTAKDVTLEDELPGGDGIDWSVAAVTLNGTAVADPSVYCWIAGDAPSQSLACEFGDLGSGDSAAVHVTSGTTQDSCGTYDNVAMADADNAAGVISPEASTTVECPGLNISKSADADEVVAGEEASFIITIWNAGPGNAFDVTLHDELPAGLTWDYEILQGSAICTLASSLEEGGVQHMSIDCDLGTLAPTSMDDGVKVRVFADTDRTVCGPMENIAFASASNNDEVSDGDSLDVRCPTLTIDKSADADEIVISGPNDALVADPAVITWTLTYTLTNGPVTNAVISDELPAGLVYVDGSASDGGVYDVATNTLTWTFATLTASGSVTFETEVDPETISRVAPTVNVAVIASDQTPEDDGQDQVTVVVEPPPLAGTPTPKPKLPDTAVGVGPNGEPITVPIELLVAFFLGSLGVLTLANVRARGRRR
jgi:uncharacterized repeat protein (TIGR01451 family)/fimbrial isopeptide formation D2 family protein